MAKQEPVNIEDAINAELGVIAERLKEYDALVKRRAQLREPVRKVRTTPSSPSAGRSIR